MSKWHSLFQHPDYEIEIKGLKVVVKKGVFTPDPGVTNSSKIILDNLTDVRDKDILDIGTGSGVIALYSAFHGAKRVVATDVDDKALDNTKENVKRYCLEDRVEVVRSNLFDNVNGMFDYVVANLPILDEAWNIEQPTTSLMERFLSQSPGFVKPGGKLYFAWASFSDAGPVKDLCKKQGYDFKVISERKLGYTWHLFKVAF
ncbi:MAG TPA: class I SAM-dependent methyltransferase [Candidatus Nanoarchaeia archaeon]|nr:class I SAM-dependent methyltransferase [Candidatus Nanoarchaeia archaeon]